jgi:hypothetical protein
MAVLVSFRKHREDAESVEYLFGFDQPVRRLRFDKASRRPEPIDGPADHEFRKAVKKIVTMLNEQQEWPDTGVYAA